MGLISNRIGIGIALIHLILATIGASRLSFPSFGFLQDVNRIYGNLSGSGTTYSFFSPGIGGQLRARFEIIDQFGNKSSVKLNNQSGHEADLRIGNIIDQFPIIDEMIPMNIEDKKDKEHKKKLQRSLTASLAGTLFGRHPEASQVTVLMEHFTPPSMEEFRDGARPEWMLIYQATYKIAKKEYKNKGSENEPVSL